MTHITTIRAMNALRISIYRPHVAIHGFTLVELMVTLLVAGILSTIAYPIYTNLITKTRRGDAMVAISAITQAQEKYRMRHSSYSDDETTLGVDTTKISSHYAISIAGLPVSGLNSGYIVTATPISTSPQAKDLRCARLLAVMQRGNLEYVSKDSTGSVTTTTECWPK